MFFFVHFLNCQQKTHANPTIINEKIKELHILTVGGVPGISNFKSCASPPWSSYRIAKLHQEAIKRNECFFFCFFFVFFITIKFHKVIVAS